MAYASTTIWSIQSGGSDSNGCGFNPANANMATDGVGAFANQTYAEFSSASYSFQSRDINHWVFIKSGTNWRPGWYRINNVASGVAELDCRPGYWIVYKSNDTARPSTSTGCATVASPTGATWSVDYSQSTGLSFSDLVAPTSTTFTSASTPIGKNFVGNIFRINSGTGWNANRWECTSVTGTTGTAGNFGPGFGNLGTAGSTGGTGVIGGPAATPGLVGGLVVGGNSVYQKGATYTFTTTTANVSGGKVSITVSASNGANPTRWIVFSSYRGDKSTSSRGSWTVPVSGFTSTTVFTVSGNYVLVENLVIDGASKTSIRGFDVSGFGCLTVLCKATGCTTGGFFITTTSTSPKVLLCESSGNSGSFPAFACSGADGMVFAFCEANSNSTLAMELNADGAQAIFCTFANNTAGVVTLRAVGTGLTNCTIYGGSGYGVYFYLNACGASCTNVYVEGAGTGFTLESASAMAFLFNCSGYNNASGNYNSLLFSDSNVVNFVSCTASALNNPASGDMSLNNTPGGGASIRAQGFPGLFPSGLFSSYGDIGAVQHADPVSILVHGGMTGGLRG